MQILIVDDDPLMVHMLRKIITRFGHQVASARNGREAMKIMHNEAYRMVICDWEMPEMDGLELCRQIRERNIGSYVYVILLTVRNGAQSIIDGLNAGADEFITKPCDPEELRVRIRTGERILSIENRDVTIFSLARLADARDPETGAHVDRLSEYSRIIARHLSRQEKYSDQVDSEFVQSIYLTSSLHDIGKVGIPDNVLLKPDPLTDEEFAVMKQHAVVGGMTLDSAIFAHPEAKYLCMARDIARSHHERFDGTGYPDGLSGDAIPLAGRIVALADVYDALTTKHIYKNAYTHQEARKIIVDGMGTQFDPDIVQAFLATEEQFQEIFRRHAAREEKECRFQQTHIEPAVKLRQWFVHDDLLNMG
jgi:putative two-component system response regulator